MGQREFRIEVFTDPSEYEETPLRDRKQDLPNLFHDKEKAEFLRDVIALANTARQWGKPAYLLFGLNDDGQLTGLSSECLKPYQRQDGVHIADLDHLRVMEQVRSQMGALIRQYVNPPLVLWDLLWDVKNNRLLAYLLIEPQSPQQAFHIATNLTSGRNRLLSAGDCWIRSGESKAKIERQCFDLSAPGYLQVPFVSPSIWLRYFERLMSSDEIEKAARTTPYIDLYDRAGNPLTEVVRTWLSERQPVLVIEGPPGSGKSTFLCRLIAEWADAGIVAMRETIRREEFSQPPGWIPVFFHLRGLSPRQDLAREVLRKVNSLGHLWDIEPSQPERLLEAEKLHWLICFDGLDELWEDRKIAGFLESVRALHRRFPKVKILISTRPLISIPDDMRRVHIAPLTTEQMLSYLRGFLSETNETIYRKLEKGLSDSASDLYSLREVCAVPLYLEALASIVAPEALVVEPFSKPILESTSSDDARSEDVVSDEIVDQLRPIRWEDAQPEEVPATISEKKAPEEENEEQESAQYEETGPPLTLGWILDRMIRRVWDRESSRYPVKLATLSHWWRATGRLSVEKLDGRRTYVEYEVAKRCYSTKRGLQWVLNLAILCASKEGIRFSHPSIQFYFGAEYLRAGNRNRLRQQCTDSFWQSVMTILNQIQYAEVSYDATE